MLKKKTQEIQKDIDALDKKKSDIEVQIEEKRNQISQLDQVALAKEAELNDKHKAIEEEYLKRKEDLYAEISKIESLRNEKQSELDTILKMLDDRETEVIEAVRDLELDKELLDKKEQDLLDEVNRVENDKRMIIEKEDEIIKETDRLIRFEKKLGKKEELFGKEYDKIKQMKEDVKATEARLVKENALSEKERDKQLDARMKEIDSAHKKIMKSIDSLKTKEDKVKKVKEYKENIKLLEKTQKLLEPRVAKIAKKILDKTEELNDATKRWEEMRSRVLVAETSLLDSQREEREVEQQVDMLEEMRTVMASEEKMADEGIFHEYLERELAKYEKTEEDYSNEIFSLIETARSLVKSGKILEARAVYSRIGDLYEQLKLEPSDKKRVYYAILELKTDIELAHLA